MQAQTRSTSSIVILVSLGRQTPRANRSSETDSLPAVTNGALANTGWAQANGRNAISWEEKFRLDVWYVQNLCFKTDVKTILLTVKEVFRREGISSDNAATMQEVTGTASK